MIFIYSWESIRKSVTGYINLINKCKYINLSFNKVSHQEFSKMKQSNNEANLREEVLKNLATAYDNFVELVANLKEGTKV